MTRTTAIERRVMEAVEQAYTQGQGAWTGCDWPTSFGHTGLDLNGISSHQALLMARATAGIESTDWLEAMHWLRLVEADADGADEAARLAVDHAARGNLELAMSEAQAACDLECRYHPLSVWMRLRDTLAAAAPRSFFEPVTPVRPSPR
jgi:hypothetical protein